MAVFVLFFEAGSDLVGTFTFKECSTSVHLPKVFSLDR